MKKIKQGIRRCSIGAIGSSTSGKPVITEGNNGIKCIEYKSLEKNFISWIITKIFIYKNAEDLDYIAEHTSISREDVSMRFDAFIKHHPDGKINRKDFRSMITTCYPEMHNCKKLEKHIFRMYDTDGDGTIDFREFMILLYIMSSGTPEENLGQIFRIFDKNNDGSIT